MDAELSVVVPCYNESGNIPALLERYAAVARELRLELILVDNGSTDDTAELLGRELGRPEYAFARSIRVDKNVGYGHGIRTGLGHCRAGAAAFSHADLQCPPEDLLRGYRLYQEVSRTGPVLVKGRRRGRTGAEAVISRSYNALARGMLGLPAVDVNGQPKIFGRELVRRLEAGPDDFAFDLFVLKQAARDGLRIVEFDVAFAARPHGRSKWAYSPFSRARGILRAFWQMTRLSFTPLLVTILSGAGSFSLAQPPRRVRYYTTVEYFLKDGAGRKAADAAKPAQADILSFGYDSTSVETKARGGFGVRAGAFWQPFASRSLVLGEEPETFLIGGSLGYIGGPVVRQRLDAKSASQGDGSVSYVHRTYFLRALAEAQARLPVNERLGLRLGMGVGLAHARSRASLSMSGSLASVSGVTGSERRSWTGLTWELSPSLSVPWGRRDLTLGLRYADFPRFKAKENSTAVMDSLDWNPWGFFLSASF